YSYSSITPLERPTGRGNVTHTVLNLAAAFQSLGHRDLIGVFEIPADGQPEGQPRGAYFDRAELLGEVKRRRFAFHIRIRGDDDLPYAAGPHAAEHALDVDLVRPHALQRRERAEQDVIDA